MSLQTLAVLSNDLRQAMLVSLSAWPQPAPARLLVAAMDDGLLVQAEDGSVLGAVSPDAAGTLFQARSVHLGLLVSGKIDEVGEVELSWRLRHAEENIDGV